MKQFGLEHRIRTKLLAFPDENDTGIHVRDSRLSEREEMFSPVVRHIDYGIIHLFE
jgi:hypothetical protein